MAKLLIPHPISVGLMLSYKCSARCRHCFDMSSPDWPGDWLSEDDIKECCIQLFGQLLSSPWGVNNISQNYGLHFTGGEPFLNFELLLKAVEISQFYHMPSTYVETNCYWCTDENITENNLSRLKEAGLKGMFISINPFFLEHIAFENTRRCVRLAKTIFGEKNVIVHHQDYYDHFKYWKIQKRLSYQDYLNLKTEQPFVHDNDLVLSGRATFMLREFYPKYAPYHFLYKPCNSVLSKNWHTHFDNYGNCMLGHCVGLSLGSWKDMHALTQQGIELDDYPILKRILANDFSGLLAFAKANGFKEKPDGYISKCDLCLDIRTSLATSRQNFAELQPAAFYQQVLHHK